MLAAVYYKNADVRLEEVEKVQVDPGELRVLPAAKAEGRLIPSRWTS